MKKIRLQVVEWADDKPVRHSPVDGFDGILPSVGDYISLTNEGPCDYEVLHRELLDQQFDNGTSSSSVTLHVTNRKGDTTAPEACALILCNLLEGKVDDHISLAWDCVTALSDKFKLFRRRL